MSAQQRRSAVVPEIVLYDKRVGDAAFMVYALLSSYVGPDGFARPTLRELAARFGGSPHAVKRHIRALSRLGYVRIEATTRAYGGRGANTYVLPHENTGFGRETDRSKPTARGPGT